MYCIYLLAFLDLPRSAFSKEGKDFDYCTDEIHFTYNDENLKFDPNANYKFYDKANPASIPLLDSKIVKNLLKYNFTTMRPPQLASIQATLYVPPNENAGNPDFICISSTGSGKTLAYLVSMIQKCIDRIELLGTETKRSPLVLIFAHTKVAAEDIFKNAMELVNGTGVKVEYIAGDTKPLREEYYDIAVCTMGRFMNHIDRTKKEYSSFNLTEVKFLIIDEADKLINFDFYQLLMKLKNFAVCLLIGLNKLRSGKTIGLY